MIKQLLSGITAIAITMTSIPAHAESTYDWQETINKAKAYEERTGKQGLWTRGKHTNAVFKQVQGADGYIFGNVLNDDIVLPRVSDIRKVIEAAKEEGKTLIVASNDWILPSNPVFCEVARQVNMNCGDFTVMLLSGSSQLSDEEFITEMNAQSERLEIIARTMNFTIKSGPSLLEQMLIDAGKDISQYGDAIAEVASLLVDEVNLEALEDALNNWDETVANYRAGTITGHLEAYAGIMDTIQEEIEVLEAEVVRLETELTAAKAEIVRQAGVISGLENTIAQKNATIAGLNSALQAASQTESELRSDLSDATGQITGISSTDLTNSFNSGKSAGITAALNAASAGYNGTTCASTYTGSLKSICDYGYAAKEAESLAGITDLPATHNANSITGISASVSGNTVTISVDSGYSVILGSGNVSITYTNSETTAAQLSVGNFTNAGTSYQDENDGNYLPPNTNGSNVSVSISDLPAAEITIANGVSLSSKLTISPDSTAHTIIGFSVFSGTQFTTTMSNLKQLSADIYKEGYNDGYNDGYADGFADGVSSVKAEN